MWPFSKKTDSDSSAPAAAESTTAASDEMTSETPGVYAQVPRAYGPYDADAVQLSDLDVSKLCDGFLDLGCLTIPLPRQSNVEVGVGPNNQPREVAITTPVGRITIMAFAAPKRTSYWRTLVSEIRDGLTRDGIASRIVDGEYGREIVGTAPGGTVRIIGADGPRWMVRATVLAPTGKDEEAHNLAIFMLRHTRVHRDNVAMPVGKVLPIVLPPQLLQQLAQQMEAQRRAQAQAQAAAQAQGGPAQQRPGTPGAQQ